MTKAEMDAAFEVGGTALVYEKHQQEVAYKDRQIERREKNWRHDEWLANWLSPYTVIAFAVLARCMTAWRGTPRFASSR